MIIFGPSSCRHIVAVPTREVGTEPIVVRELTMGTLNARPISKERLKSYSAFRSLMRGGSQGAARNVGVAMCSGSQVLTQLTNVACHVVKKNIKRWESAVMPPCRSDSDSNR